LSPKSAIQSFINGAIRVEPAPSSVPFALDAPAVALSPLSIPTTATETARLKSLFRFTVLLLVEFACSLTLGLRESRGPPS
jgi:hypothetical protein